ncbi:MAG: TonB-dependent receptor [Bacteroidota bacterium]
MQYLKTAFKFLTLLPLVTWGQIKLQVVDTESHTPIEGVQILLKEVSSSSRTELVLTNESGLAFSDFNPPVTFEMSHISYESASGTLNIDSENIPLKAKSQILEDVVVTGQHHPQSAWNSMYNVQTIDREQIEGQGAIQLQEVLQTQLKLTVNPDIAIGSSGLTMQGISGLNVKVLVDGVPLVGRNGNGSNTDLSQVNLSNIDRIEIVEGPMAVNYGANALAGVINLITKKSSGEKVDVGVSIQEETVGNNYGINSGRRNQNVSLGYQITDRLYSSISATRDEFNGFGGVGRAFEWDPKTQYFLNGKLGYSFDQFNVSYTLDFLDETIDNLGASQDNIQQGTGVNFPFAIDEEFRSKRIFHQLHADGRLSRNTSFNTVISYSDFEREKTRFSRDFTSGETNLTTGEGDQDTSTYTVWVLRGSVQRSFLEGRLSAELGYDFNLEEAGGGRISQGERSLQDYGFYGSVEAKLGNLSVRPGIRASINTQFSAPVTPSVNLKYDFNENTQVRFAYARGFRAPSIRELYFEFIDSNHRIIGNESLEPERAHHLEAGFSKRFSWRNNSLIKFNLSGFYNDLDNLITIGQSAEDPTAASFVNISEFQTTGFTISQDYIKGELSLSTGFSYIGRFNQLSESDEPGLETFLFSPEFNASLSYRIKPLNTSVNLNYKYTGAVPNYVFVANEETGEEELTLGEIEGFSWMNLTLSRPVTKYLKATLGVKNLLDVQRVGNTTNSGGAHSGGDSLPIGFGRSYFLNVQFNF